MSTPVLLPPYEAIIDAYRREMAATGGSEGLRDEGGLRSALARAENLIAHAEATPAIEDIAATVAFGIARNHPFVDGNKRMALISAFVILRMNGLFLDAPEGEAVTAILRIADGTNDEKDFAVWLKRWTTPA